MPQYDFEGDFANANLLGRDGYLPHLKTLAVSQCLDRVVRPGRRAYHVSWRAFARALRNKLINKCKQGWYRFLGWALQYQNCRGRLHSADMCVHNVQSCPLGMVAAHLTLFLAAPAGYALDSGILETYPPSHKCEQLGVGIGYTLWNPTGFRMMDILYSRWPIFALLAELRPMLPRLWNQTNEIKASSMVVQLYMERLSLLHRELSRLKGDRYEACLLVCQLLSDHYILSRHCPVLAAERRLEQTVSLLKGHGRGPWTHAVRKQVEESISDANDNLVDLLKWLQASHHEVFSPAARIITVFLISANIIFPHLARIQSFIDRDLYLQPSMYWARQSISTLPITCPALVWPEQGSLSADALYVKDFHSQLGVALPRAEVLRNNMTSQSQAWVVFLWGNGDTGMEERIRVQAEVIRTLSFSVRRTEAPFNRPFVVLTIGRIADDIARDFHLDGLQVRALQSNETLLAWHQEATYINQPLGQLSDWFSDRKIPQSFAQLAAWALRQFSRVVVLDSDMLMLQRCDELFDVGNVPFAASYETHFRQTEPDGQKDTVLLNAAVMSLRPDPSIFRRIQDALLWPAFRFAVENLAAGGSPTFQSLIDIFLLDTSRRRGFASWDMEEGRFGGCGQRAAPLGENASGNLVPVWLLDHGDHCILPMEYNFFVDFPHILHLAMSSQIDSAFSFVGEGNLERHEIFNRTIAWLRETGHLRTQPKIIHFPGVKRKPWQRWARISRSPWDEAWWTAHEEMCSLSKAPCIIRCATEP